MLSELAKMAVEKAADNPIALLAALASILSNLHTRATVAELKTWIVERQDEAISAVRKESAPLRELEDLKQRVISIETARPPRPPCGVPSWKNPN